MTTQAPSVDLHFATGHSSRVGLTQDGVPVKGPQTLKELLQRGSRDSQEQGNAR